MKTFNNIRAFIKFLYAIYLLDSQNHYYYRWLAWGSEKDYKKYVYYLEKTEKLKHYLK